MISSTSGLCITIDKHFIRCSSIFTGALHNKPIGRDMIGDWYLRATLDDGSPLGSGANRVGKGGPEGPLVLHDLVVVFPELTLFLGAQRRLGGRHGPGMAAKREVAKDNPDIVAVGVADLL